MNSSRGKAGWKCGSKVKKITIPASVTQLTRRSFERAGSVEEITFEANSRLTGLESGTCGRYKSLKSICIAASVEFIDQWCFYDLETELSAGDLEKVTFEEGSKVREIAEYAFSDCNSLQSISFPASLDSRAWRFSTVAAFQYPICWRWRLKVDIRSSV
jgi:hypothetical protein